jgi:hypothetical protein
VEPFPRVPGVRYQIATGSNYPLWSPDGKELFYRSRATDVAVGGPAAIHRVEVRSDGAFTFTNETTLPVPGLLAFNNYSNYDITPDGKRFLILIRANSTAATASPLIHIVQNWFEELKRLR